MSRPVLAGCLEPAAEEALRAEPTLETADVTAISIAISLKRIADELAVNSPDSTKTTLGDLVQAIADRMIP